jgi:hypothetical protein
MPQLKVAPLRNEHLLDSAGLFAAGHRAMRRLCRDNAERSRGALDNAK